MEHMDTVSYATTKARRSLRALGGRPSVPVVIFTALVAAYLSGSVVLDGHLDYTGDYMDAYPSNFLTALQPADLLPWLGLAAVIFVVLFLLGRLVASRGQAARQRRGSSSFSRSLADGYEVERNASVPAMSVDPSELTGDLAGHHLIDYYHRHAGLFWGITCLVFLAWFSVWVMYYPGTSMNDQIGIINDPLYSSTGHPLLYCLLLSGFVKGSIALFGDGAIGFAAYTLIQMLACAAIVAAMCCWLRWRAAKMPMVIIVALLFAFVPVVADNAICSIKDTLFNFVMLLWIPFFDQFLRRRGAIFYDPAERHYYLVLCVITGITRNNGLVVAPLLMLGVVIASIGHTGMRQIVTTSLLALVLMLVPSGLTKLMGADYRASEALGTPLQQMCAVYSSSEGHTTDAQREVINGCIGLDYLSTDYWPAFTDGIKYQGHMNNDWINEHQSEVIQTWIEIGTASPANFDIYVRAWLSGSYGNWSLTAPCSTGQSFFFRQVNNFEAGTGAWYQQKVDEYGIRTRSLLPTEVTASFKAFWEPLVTCPCTGTLFAIVLVLATLACNKEGTLSRGLLPYWPSILLWASLMVSSPFSFALRYGLSLLLAIPFLVCLIILPVNRTGEQGIMSGAGMDASVARLRRSR
ncbi:MAG: DUF6020 family protein [Atopobiaceae bacterium]|nr:DUF6020 family protein [Atopobiaceae bacterium]MCH4214182.1 DUF6020 family protein [Atopobiaceae bacterium]MCI1260479.1 DUF6020 family protein [Atopobiaceae bacterium]MDD3176715.1 DUF6020 family protein [Atopobiaceae bacterium]MDD4381238.1 DUF6020 family protein [Atopobiaceae bacterium]